MAKSNNGNYDVITALKTYPKIYDDDYLNKLIIDSLYECDATIAETIVYIYEDKLCFIDNKWFFYNEFLWDECNFTNKVICEFVKLYDIMKGFIINESNINDIKKQACIVQINNIVINIKKNKNIIILLEDKLAKKNVFDLNVNIMAFNNGVFDFETMTFRKIVSHDMIKTSCGYDYRDKFEEKQKLIDMLLNLFQTKECMDFFLTYIACSICGLNNINALMLLMWENIRPKEKLLDLLTSTFGKYCYQINDLSLIINLNDKSKELSRLSSVRFVFANFINHVSPNIISQLIDLKRIKYNIKNDVEFIDINFTTFCICDRIPIIDKEIDNNTILIELPNNNYLYNPININKNDFFLLLLEYLQRFKNGDSEMNIEIIKQMFKKNNMTSCEKICHDFMEDCIDINDGRVKCVDIYNKYVEWADTKNLDTQIVRTQLFAELKKYATYNKSVRFNDTFTSAFIGMTLKTEIDIQNNFKSQIPIHYTRKNTTITTNISKKSPNHRSEYQYIYIIHISKLKNRNELTYKYGRTSDIFRRFYGYSKNSTLLYLRRVVDCIKVESEIRELFYKNYIQEKKYGNEYFSGDINKMITNIDYLIDSKNQSIDNDIMNEIKCKYRTYLQFDIINDNNKSENEKINVIAKNPPTKKIKNTFTIASDTRRVVKNVPKTSTLDKK